MRFKERDFVIVNPNLQPGTVFNTCAFTHEMTEYYGETMRVRHIIEYNDHRYVLYCPNLTSMQNRLLASFFWVDEMLLPAAELCNEGLVHLLKKEVGL